MEHKFHSAAELYSTWKDHTKFVQTEEEKSQFDCLKTHLDNYLDATWWQEILSTQKRLGVAGRVDLIGIHKGKQQSLISKHLANGKRKIGFMTTSCKQHSMQWHFMR